MSGSIYTAKDEVETDFNKSQIKDDSSSGINIINNEAENDVDISRIKLDEQSHSRKRTDNITSYETSKGDETIDPKNNKQSCKNKELTRAQTIDNERKHRDSTETDTLPMETTSMSEADSLNIVRNNAENTINHIHSNDDLNLRDANKDLKLLNNEEKIKTEIREGMSTSPKSSLVSGFDAWERCLNEPDFEQRANNLLKEGNIPKKQQLETICSIYNRKSNIVQVICHHICSYLKRLSDSIIHVWPAYRYDKRQIYHSNEYEIIFVLITRQHMELTTEFDSHNTYQRCIVDISPQCKQENNDIQELEAKSKLPIQFAKLKECLRTNAKALMKDHSNVSRVSLGWIKGSGYAAGSRKWKESPCITLYVHVKGLVPLSEEPFVETIQNFDVDVREGVFELCGRANEFHQHIKMGCAMDSGYGTKQGTVGPFVKYELDSHIYYITSAHVVLDSGQWQNLLDKRYNFFGEFGIDTFQPPESESVANNTRHPLGKTVLAVYKEGNETEAGVEVALVRIKDDRNPLDSTFPDSSTIHSREFSSECPFVFFTGNVFESASLSQPFVVYKFGSVSGLTKGICNLNDASSVRTSTLYGKDLGFNITLHGQIEIESKDCIPFGDVGDSGSLVLTKQGDTLVAVGIFEGKMNNTYFVTPIQDILQELGELLSLNRQSPQQQNMEIDMEEVFSPMVIRVNYTEPSHTLDNQFATNTQENLETNIAHFTEHKINSMKTELTALRTELVQNMTHGFENVTQQFEALKQFLSNQPK